MTSKFSRNGKVNFSCRQEDCFCSFGRRTPTAAISKDFHPHLHLQFHPRTRAILEQLTDSAKLAPQQQQQQQHTSADKIEILSAGGGRSVDKEYSYVKFPRRDLHHEYSYPKLTESILDEGSNKDKGRLASAKSSFKRQHLPIEKTNSGGSEPGKISLVLIGSGSSLVSSNYESSNSGSGSVLRTPTSSLS